jgi:hypothetical protein
MTTEADGGCTLRLRRLPPANQRSLGGALKLYFFKTVLASPAADRLRWIEFDGNEPRFGSQGLQARAAEAKRVLLLVHGLWGDTRTLAEGVAATELWRNFDLVLAWDYENLNTPLESVADDLKSALMAAGFGPEDGRHLSVLAHNMGGLVIRSLVEQKGGAAFIDHVVMCGTPSGGSPVGLFDSARRMVTWGIGLAGPGLKAVLPWVGTLLLVLDQSKKLTVALDQLNPASDFLKGLARADDPRTRYTLLAGSLAACEAAGDPLPRRLAMKLGQSAAIGLLFGDEPHDGFSALPSVTSVPSARQPAPTVVGPLACHNFSYFSAPAALAALQSVEW